MSETASKSGIPGWYVEFQAALLRQAPRPLDIDQATAECWIKNQAGLHKILAESLLPPKTTVQVEKQTKSLNSRSNLLDFVGTVELSVTATPFVAKDRFVKNTSDGAPVKICDIWGGLKTRFFQGEGKIEPSIGDTELRYARLKKRSVDGPIFKEIWGGKKPWVTLTEVWALLTKQPDGDKKEYKNGPLLVNGYPNIFYVETEVILLEEEHIAYDNDKGKKVVLCAVDVSWTAGKGWNVSVSSVLNDDPWCVGSRVFSRWSS